MLRYGRSRSFKVIGIGTNRKPVCNFQLVFHCNYMVIFYPFRHISIYWSKISLVFRHFTYPNLIWCPLTWGTKFRKLESLGSVSIPACDIQTDRQSGRLLYVTVTKSSRSTGWSFPLAASLRRKSGCSVSSFLAAVALRVYLNSRSNTTDHSTT